jgi:peptide/nickel transport system permease protein
MAGARETDVAVGLVKRGRRSRVADFLLRLVKEKPLGTIGGVIVLVLLFSGIFADVLAPYGMSETHLMDKLSGPSGTYLLGTDQLGRDILSRIIYGARVSVIIGLGATSLNLVIALLIGTTTGFFGGKLDIVVQRFVDAWMAFPGLLILITMMSLVGQGQMQIILVLGITGGIGGSRISRSAVIGIRENMYMHAAEAIGVGTVRTILRHVLPNIMAPMIIIFTVTIGGVIMSEASLSFLGFGLPPDVPSWGGMLSTEGRRYMEFAPHMAIWPGLALTLVVYGINMFGDALRDLLDPRLRGGVGRYSGGKEKKLRKIRRRAGTHQAD